MLPKTANIFNGGLDAVTRREGIPNISKLQEDVAKMEEVSHPSRPDTAAPTIEPY